MRTTWRTRLLLFLTTSVALSATPCIANVWNKPVVYVNALISPQWEKPLKRALWVWNITTYNFPHLELTNNTQTADITVTSGSYGPYYAGLCEYTNINFQTAHYYKINIKLNNDPSLTTQQRQAVTAHEIGHALGLGHTQNPTSIMQETQTGAQTLPNNEDKWKVNAHRLTWKP